MKMINITEVHFMMPLEIDDAKRFKSENDMAGWKQILRPDKIIFRKKELVAKRTANACNDWIESVKSYFGLDDRRWF